MRLALLALALAGCDALPPAWQVAKPPRESAENFCVEQANQRQQLDPSCALCQSDWDAVYTACLARFVGVARPGDGGASD